MNSEKKFNNMYIHIRSMPEAQNKIYDRIRDKTDQIEHIIKLILYPHAQEVHHWKKELVSFLMKVPKLKKNNKFPKSSWIQKPLKIYNDQISNLVLQVKDIEHDLIPIEISDQAILEIVEEYQDWLADELSTKGFILPSVAYQKLSELTGCD